MTPQDIIVASSSSLLSTRLGGDFVILNLVDEKYYGLDAVGARIWELLQEPRAVGEIIEMVYSEYDAERAQVERDVESLISDLSARSLVTISTRE